MLTKARWDAVRHLMDEMDGMDEMDSGEPSS